MRAVFTLISLLIVVAVIGVMSKKQMSTLMPTGLPPEIATEANVSSTVTNAPLEKLPDQYKKALDDAMQKSRSDVVDQ